MAPLLTALLCSLLLFVQFAYGGPFYRNATISHNGIMPLNRTIPSEDMPKTKSRIVSLFHSCSSHQQMLLAEAMAAIPLMTSRALAHTLLLHKTLLGTPTSDFLADDDDVLNTLMMFETIYGPVWLTADRSEALDKVWNVTDRIANMNSAFKQPGFAPIQFICDHTYREGPKDPAVLNEPMPNGDTYLYWDTRDASMGGQRYVWTVGRSCATGLADTQTVRSTPAWGSLDLIVLCPMGWDYAWNQQFSESLVELTPAGSGYNSLSLEDISLRSLAATLLHEISHSATIFEKPTSDIPDSKGVQYGWEPAVEHAGDPNKALVHADSFMFYVLAMYLDQWNWSTGYNGPRL